MSGTDRRTGGLLALSALLLHLVLCGGSVVWTNTTDLDGNKNVTLLLAVVEETGVAGVTGVVTVATQRAGRLPRAEEQGSGMLGGEGAGPEGVGPEGARPEGARPEGAGHEGAGPEGAGPRLSPDSAETEMLLPSNQEEGEEEEARPPWLDLDLVAMTTAPPPAASPSLPDPLLTVAFLDPVSHGNGDHGDRPAPPSPSPSPRELQGGDPTAWAPDSYDYLTPYEDASPSPDDYYSSSPPSPSSPSAPPSLPPGGADGAGGCRRGYRRLNQTCRSPCDGPGPSPCLNGGQCLLLEGSGMFCRCNVQDYIWYKGSRCESVVTEFQVLVLAVGAAAILVLLLFMIVVCFAKKLHVLKTENSQLRKRSKYPPASEQHHDNFSLSTIAEGSHPNVRKLCSTPPAPPAHALAYYDNIICQDDPSAQNKLEDLKAPPPDDDLNIHNTLTPKHHNHPSPNPDPEACSLQNNMM